MFSGPFVRLFVSRMNYWPDFHKTLWKDLACKKEEPIKFWFGSESQDKYIFTLINIVR